MSPPGSAGRPPASVLVVDRGGLIRQEIRALAGGAEHCRDPGGMAEARSVMVRL